MSNRGLLKVVLISPGNLLNQDSEGGRSVVYSPNLGLTYISNYIEKLFKSQVEVLIIEIIPEGISDKDLENIILEYNPELVGISSKSFNILSAYKYSKLIKSINDKTIVVLGGAHGSALPEYTIKECPYIDIVVRGEGEIAFSAIVKSLLERKSDFIHVDGIVYRRSDGKIITTSKGHLLADLDEVPFPTYEKYNLRNYNMGLNPITGKKENFFSMFGSRGCPYICSFCMPLLTRKVRKRDPGKIVEEINYLIEMWDAKFVYFEDSCMTVDKEWFIDVCEELIRNKTYERISWGFETRVDAINKEIFVKAVQAGSIYVNFGLESGSNYVLNKNGKHFKTNDILKAIAIARGSGIEIIHGSFILGLPYESHRSIEETLNLINCLGLNMIPINIIDVYPGTELFDMVENGEGGIRWLNNCRFNWEKYERNKCQTEVNDLKESDLIDYYNKALALVEEKTGQRLTI